MSEENKTSEGQVASTVAAAITTPAPAQQAQAGDDKAEPKWLPSRLEREKAKVFEDLGATPDEIKQALADKKAQLEAKKTAEEKALELQKEVEKANGKNAKLQKSLKAYADSQLSTLTPEQKQAVESLAGDDPADQLKAISALTPTWHALAQAAAQATQAAQQATQATDIKDTAPGRNAPGAATVVYEEEKQTFERLKEANPFQAADFARSKGLVGRF